MPTWTSGTSANPVRGTANLEQRPAQGGEWAVGGGEQQRRQLLPGGRRFQAEIGEQSSGLTTSQLHRPATGIDPGRPEQRNVAIHTRGWTNTHGHDATSSSSSRCSSPGCDAGCKHEQLRVPKERLEGEEQRVALARALAGGADLLLVDEPTAELDEANRDHTLALLRAAAGQGTAVVVAIHDPAVVACCDRMLRLTDGGEGAPAGPGL